MTRIRSIIFRIPIKKNTTNDTVPCNLFNNENSPEKLDISRESIDKFNKMKKVDQYEHLSKHEPNKGFKNIQTIIILFLTLFLGSMISYYIYYFGTICTDKKIERAQPQINLENLTKPSELPPPPKPNSNQCIVIDNDKLDCFPQGKVDKESCENRGCCWVSKDGNPLGVPYCFYPSNSPSYNYINVTETLFGYVAFLKRNFKSWYPDDVEIIKLTVTFETESRLHIKITDPAKDRFEPPYPEISIVDRASSKLKYRFVLDAAQAGFKIVRSSDNTTIFDALEFDNFIYSNQFLQISGKLPSDILYGIGEHTSGFMLPTNWSRFTLFNHDAIPAFDKNLYGSQPFYLLLENSSNAHGVFLLNSNAMDILLQPSPIITYRTIGGVLDFFFFLGPTPKDVISQYTELIGRPQLPPYWGLGFHLCRFGYKTLEETEKIMKRNIDAGIPLDTQWNDLDYMNNSNDFTYDKKNFKNLPKFVDDLHTNGMHYIPLIDPGVSASEIVGTYPPFDEGVRMDIFVKNSTDQIFIGKVWNKGTTVWPDFTSPKTVEYWTKMLKNLHDQIGFDGAWIDMNEPSNFYSGSVNGCPKNSLENPPYVPNIDGGFLNYKTMCMSCKHHAGLHYNVHNLYGLSEAIVTNFALAEIRGKRPMVISRASFPGLGRYSGHWSGDVWSAWTDMRYSIPQLLSFSLFGIPLMGADICGFNGNSTEKLCNRWMQLGAFYPFSRNHNTDDGIDQDPVAFGELVVNSSKKALEIRYSLLPYLYTLFWDANLNGNTVARPLFFEFPNDTNTYKIDTQFLWGPAFMIVPVLEENAVSVKTYLPNAIWYDFYTKKGIKSNGQIYNISAPLDTIPLFIRGGHVIPQQLPGKTTTQSRKNPVELIAALDDMGNATGQLYWDDGESLNTYEENAYTLIEFLVTENKMKVTIGQRYELPPNLASITILGIANSVTSVTLNGTAINFTYDSTIKVLSVSKLDKSFEADMIFAWK